MTLRKWCEEYLEQAPHVAPLTIEQDALWLQNTGINPMTPRSSDPYPASSGSGVSSPTVNHARVKVSQLTGSAYNCGNPGGKVSLFSGNLTLPSCSWDASVLASGITELRLKYVTSGGVSCSDDSGCTSPEVCGFSIVNTDTSTCGTLKGYWTSDQVCSVKTSLTDLNCPFLLNLYACTGGLASCYSQSATTGCCGCADWWTDSVLDLTTPNAVPYNNSSPGTYAYPLGTTQCVNYNPKWTTNVLPQLKPLKQICPTMYTYPFDDMTSTFVCNNGQNPAPLNYFVIFCPDTNRPSAPISGNSTSRTVVIINKCSYDVWPAIAGGAVFNKATISASSGNVVTCTTDSDCIAGSKCRVINTMTGAQACYWVNPSSEEGVFKLSGWSGSGEPEKATYKFPISSDTVSGLTTLVWSGIITGRTGCVDGGSTTTPCATSDCGQDPSSGKYGENCKPGVGFDQPGGQAEFSFQTAPVDFYDIEVINGIVGVWNTGTSSLELLGIEILPNVTLT